MNYAAAILYGIVVLHWASDVLENLINIVMGVF